MASSITNSFYAMLALLLLGSLFFKPSSAITKTDVTTVCSQTLNPSFCSAFLNSIPGLTTATFKDLAQITVNAVQSEAGKTSELINQLGQQKRVPREKETLVHCFQYYSQVKQEMLNALSSLARGARIQVQFSAAISVGLAMKCQAEVKGTTLPLAANNLRVEGYSSVLDELSRNL